MDQRPPGEVLIADEDVHGHVGGETSGADAVGDPHPAEVLHGSRVTALHLGQAAGPRPLVGQHAAHSELAELDRQGQADRPAPGDQDIRVVHRGQPFTVSPVRRMMLPLKIASRSSPDRPISSRFLIVALM